MLSFSSSSGTFEKQQQKRRCCFEKVKTRVSVNAKVNISFVNVNLEDMVSQIKGMNVSFSYNRYISGKLRYSFTPG
jgi:hypothetical protein